MAGGFLCYGHRATFSTVVPGELPSITSCVNTNSAASLCSHGGSHRKASTPVADRQSSECSMGDRFVNHLAPGADAPTRRQAWRRSLRWHGARKGAAVPCCWAVASASPVTGGGRRLSGGLTWWREKARPGRRGCSTANA